MLRDFLAAYYGIQAQKKTVWYGAEGFMDSNYVYFTISAKQKEIIHMEQAALAYYLYENHCPQIAIPVPNSQGEWYTKYNDHYYMVLRADHTIPANNSRHGEQLAAFHLTGAAYQYEPQTISSYGQWKTLWIDKITAFEKKIETEADDHPNAYYRLLMDSLPYVIGISENAIQYMQETESEPRFHEADQGTIVFRRYNGQFKHRALWVTDLAYDHPSRDLAEYIRIKLLEKKDPMTQIQKFLADYQRVRPLSIFSWRLLYARLLYPIHLFDMIERGFSADQSETVYADLSALLEWQPVYEKRLGSFFENAGIDCKDLQIPVLHWL
ncbi:spore coat protein YutH [Lentibacillus halodurans]|uniref:Spore coat protein YutH n=1 Tax=Lentibacillus halodurans TaxID=237679 RepID=A0A1I0WS81_9BACI|nr:hypothetical protein [Lentibacillus halodurans]SFA91267.1 spore coat protein YutH [Lentibacillus halodurans]